MNQDGDGSYSTLEIVVGAYEHFVLGYSVFTESETTDDGHREQEKFYLKPSFTNNSHCGSIRSICSIQKFIASGSSDEVIRLFNLASRTEHGTLQQHNGTVTCLTAFHSYLFSGSDDGTICIWKSGSWQCEKTLRAHEGGVLAITVHPSGKLALSIGRDKSLKTWNLIKGRSGFITNLKGIADSVGWSTDGNYYAVAIANRLDVYSLEYAKVIYTIAFSKRIRRTAFLKDQVVAVAGDKQTVEIHDVSLKRRLCVHPVHKSRVKDMNYVEKQKLLITISNADGFIKIWKFPEEKYYEPPVLVAEVDTTCRITCLAIWDKALIPLKNQHGPDVDEAQGTHEILQESEDDKSIVAVQIEVDKFEPLVLKQKPHKAAFSISSKLRGERLDETRERRKAKRSKRN